MSNLTIFDHDEYVIEAIPVREFSEKQFLIFFTKQGMVKKSTLNLYDSPRYSRSMIALNLREDDELINVSQSNGQNYIFLDRKSTRLNSSHVATSYAVFCLKNKY